jgi:hypothetical protein
MTCVLKLRRCTLKMEAARMWDIFVPAAQTIRCHAPEEYNLHFPDGENFGSLVLHYLDCLCGGSCWERSALLLTILGGCQLLGPLFTRQYEISGNLIWVTNLRILSPPRFCSMEPKRLRSSLARWGRQLGPTLNWKCRFNPHSAGSGKIRLRREGGMNSYCLRFLWGAALWGRPLKRKGWWHNSAGKVLDPAYEWPFRSSMYGIPCT